MLHARREKIAQNDTADRDPNYALDWSTTTHFNALQLQRTLFSACSMAATLALFARLSNELWIGILASLMSFVAVVQFAMGSFYLYGYAQVPSRNLMAPFHVIFVLTGSVFTLAMYTAHLDSVKVVP